MQNWQGDEDGKLFAQMASMLKNEVAVDLAKYKNGKIDRIGDVSALLASVRR